jgi:hypothetical protein
MANYHPLDVRHKPAKAADRQPKAQPWRISEPKTDAWQRKGPIQDDPRVEQRKREAHSRDIEKEERQKIPLASHLFTPARLFYEARALLRSKSGVGYSKFQIAAQVVGALVMYFVLFRADTMFGINDFLKASLN